jgi:hypothetical protein
MGYACFSQTSPSAPPLGEEVEIVIWRAPVEPVAVGDTTFIVVAIPETTGPIVEIPMTTP